LQRTVEGCFDILKFQSKAFLKSGMAAGCAVHVEL
jgi:hypothetical protein